MRTIYLVIAWVAILRLGAAGIVAAAEPTAPAPSASAAPSTDEQAIRSGAQKYVESFNRRDSKTMASMWSPEGVYTDPSTGESVVGRAALETQFNEAFAGSGDSKLQVEIESIDFISPNVAMEKGTARVTSSGGEPDVGHFTAVHVKRDGQWLLDRVTEEEEEQQPVPVSNYEHLKELEWMVGSWVDADKDPGVDVQTDCEWTKNKNFMTRSFAVSKRDRIDTSGMQIIGWDPAAKQIRSWVFDSTGGFAEGKWTRKGDRWFIQSAGTLPDGGKSTAVNIITRLDDNSFTWESTHRDVDGELLPNVDPITVVRNPTE